MIRERMMRALFLKKAKLNVTFRHKCHWRRVVYFSSRPATTSIANVDTSVTVPGKNGPFVAVNFQDGHQALFHSFWLRDNSEWDPQTFQRSVDTVSISPSVHPHDSKFTENEVTFDWNDGSSTSFSAEFLRNWSYWDAKDINSGQTATTTSTPQHINSSNGHAVKEFGLHGNGYKNWWAIHSEKDYHQPSETVWDTETLRRESSSREKPVSSNGYVYWSGMLSSDPKLPSVSYEAFIESNKSLQDCLETIARWGFCCVDNVPHTMEATEKACRRISFPRPTLYSEEGMWRTEVRPEGNDTAYSSQALNAHTDGTYLEDMPGLQAFHCLHADVSGGGKTLLVDGFKVANALRREYPQTFEFFTQNPAAFQFKDKDYSLLQWKRILQLNNEGEVTEFAFNNDDRSPIIPLPGQPPSYVDDFYGHLRILIETIRRGENELWFPLLPGTLLIFNNRRVLHGRSAFSTTSGRILAGCYLNKEDWQSKLKVISTTSHES